MKTVNGKYNEAKIFTDVVDEGSVAQIQAMCDTPIFSQSKIRIMPDVHAGCSEYGWRRYRLRNGAYSNRRKRT